MYEKRDFIKNCVDSNPSGIHQYEQVTYGEICKFCGLSRSTIEGIRREEAPVLSPIGDEVIKSAIKSEGTLSELTIKSIFREAKGKSAIILTFGDIEAYENMLITKDFKINTANVKFEDIDKLLQFVQLALSGKLGGQTRVVIDKDEKTK